MVRAQILDNVWVLYGTQKTTLLLKFLHDSCSTWGSKLEEGAMKDFSSTGQVVTHGLADSTIRPNAKILSFEELNSSIVKLILRLGLLSHCSRDLQMKVTASIIEHQLATMYKEICTAATCTYVR